ncbi:MAG: beta-ketoacyl-ACP synthase II [bacterium]
MRHRVVVTGLGVISPIGNSVPLFFSSLLQGKSGIEEIKAFDTTGYSTRIGGEIKDFNADGILSEKEKRRFSLFIQYGLAATQEAIIDSGISLSQEDLRRIGVLVGSGIGGLDVLEREHSVLLKDGSKRVSPFLIPMMIIDMASGVISIKFGFSGPNLAIATACATSTHTIGEAFRLIQYGSADVMVCGGCEGAITPLGLAGFCAARALSTRNNEPQKASRPFDGERDGFVMSNGAGILILENESHAKKRGVNIYAEIVGYGMSADAYHITAPKEDGSGASLCMENALADANISIDKISCINAHGTSTKLNDKAETLAIKNVFGDYSYKIPITANKSMTGHLLGGAGAIEAIASCLTIKNNIIPPTINYEYKDPDCDLDYVPNIAKEAKIDYVLSNSFGFGGHNASIVFKRYE